ncbi:MAG: DUF1850 domain-containing protein [Aquisalimonadaceae bacterium]
MFRVCLTQGRACLPALLLLLAGIAPAQPASSAETAMVEVLSASEDVLMAFSVQPGGRWCLAWNHSVTGIRVLDCYQYDDGRMVLERSHQPDFAAGLGHVAGRGIQRSDGSGGYWIEQINEPVPGNRYLLRVGSPAVNHRILRGASEASLSALAAGQQVTIRLTTGRESP